MTQQETVLNLFPSPMREVLVALASSGKCVVDGYDIHVNLSKTPTLPPSLQPRHYVLKRRGGNSKASNSAQQKETFELAPTRVLCFSKYRLNGNLSDYTISIKGKKLDTHQNPVPDSIFGSKEAEKPEFLSWNEGGEHIDRKAELGIELHPKKDPAKYAFYLLSHLDAKNPVMGEIDRSAISNKLVGLFSFKDITKESTDRNATRVERSHAITWVDSLKGEQLKLLKSKVVGDLGTEAMALQKCETKDSIANELCNIADKGYAKTILKYQEIVGNAELPALDVAKGILSDAMAMGIMELDKKHGLLINLKYDAHFSGLCKSIQVGEGVNTYARLQFYEYTQSIAKKVSEYIANSPNIAEVIRLVELVEKMRLNFPEEEVTSSGVVPEFISLRSSNGIFSKK